MAKVRKAINKPNKPNQSPVSRAAWDEMIASKFAKPADAALDRIAQGSVGELIFLLTDSEEPVRLRAAEALGEKGPAAAVAVEHLIPLLREPKALLQATAAKALGRIGRAAAAAVGDLVLLLKSTNEWVRVHATKALGEIGPAAAVAVQHLIPLRKDPVGLVQEEAVKALRRIRRAKRTNSARDTAGAVREAVEEAPKAIHQQGLEADAEVLEPDLRLEHTDGGMSVQELQDQLFAGLDEAPPEQRLTGLVVLLDGFRDAVREKAQNYILDYIQNHNPTTADERQQSVDIINGMTKRLGFALEHPDHPGQHCYLSLTVTAANMKGQIRLLAEGAASKPLDLSAHLSKFAYLRVIDAVPPIKTVATETSASSPHLSRLESKASSDPATRTRRS